MELTDKDKLYIKDKNKYQKMLHIDFSDIQVSKLSKYYDMKLETSNTQTIGTEHITDFDKNTRSVEEIGVKRDPRSIFRRNFSPNEQFGSLEEFISNNRNTKDI